MQATFFIRKRQQPAIFQPCLLLMLSWLIIGYSKTLFLHFLTMWPNDYLPSCNPYSLLLIEFHASAFSMFSAARIGNLSLNFTSPEHMNQTMLKVLMVPISRSWLKSRGFLHITNSSIMAKQLTFVQIFISVNSAESLFIFSYCGHLHVRRVEHGASLS